MGFDRRLIRGALVAAALAGCREPRPDQEATPVRPPMPSAAPVDHLAKGELLEGPEKAITLPLPRGATIDFRFPQLVRASTLDAPEDVANFIRARVRDGAVTPGASATVFEGVRVPAAPDVKLTIRVQKHERGLGTMVEVRDSTPPPAVNLPDEASRWKAAGFGPDGKPLDPKSMQ